MKKLLVIIISILSVVGLNAQKGKKKDGYKITVKVENSKDPQIYLAYHLGDKKYIRDTATAVKKGTYVFEGDEALPGGIYIIFFENKQNFEIVVDEQEFTIETDTINFVENFSTKDSKQNEIFYGFLKYSGEIGKKATPISKERMEILEKLQEEGLGKKKKEELEARKKELEDQLREFEKQIKEYRAKVFEEHKGEFATKTLKAVDEPQVPKEIPDSMRFSYYRSHYFDNLDLSDDRMMRTPILHGKIIKFLDKLTVQHPDSIKKAADLILSKTKEGSEMFRYLTITMTNKYGKSKIMGMDEVFVHMIENYYNTGKAFWADSADLKRLSDRARTIRWTMIGNNAPNLMLKDTNDNFIQLYQVQAPYTLLYFWDPDCGHCKKTTPKLVKVYNEVLKDKGVKVFAVTTTVDKKKWLKGIHDMKMEDFINTYDPDYKTGFRQLYDITSTPKVYMVDGEKKIIAKQLGVDQLEDFLQQYEKVEEMKKQQ